MVSTKDSLPVLDCAFVVNSQCADSTRDCEIIDIRSLRHKTCSESELVAREDLNLVDDMETLLQRGQNVPKHQPSGPVKLKYLDGLRGVASLLVVHIHASYLRELTIAPSSVDVFFVLSAFLLTMLNESKIRKLVNNKANFRQWMIVLLDYFVKRILRVYPLFALVACVLTWMSEESRTHYYNLAHYHIQEWSVWEILTFKKRYYLFWTMPIEITYYFLIPVFLSALCYLNKIPQVKWSIVGMMYIWVYYEGSHTNRAGHDEFRPHLSTFLAGSLAAVVYLEVSKWMKNHHYEPRKWQIAAVRVFEFMMLGSIISDVCRGSFRQWLGGSLFPYQPRSVPVVGLPISAVIVIEALAPSAISRALEWNILCYSGKISFSMYLLHPFVNFSPWLVGIARTEQFILRLVLVYALATASYFVVERNCQRLAVAIGERLKRTSWAA